MSTSGSLSICLDPPDVRLVVLGHRKVGKTALTVRFLTKRFIGEYEECQERMYSRKIALGNHDTVKFEVRDVTIKVEQSSLKDLKSIVWGEGFAVTYSITDRSSFNSALQIISAIHEQKKTKDVVIALIGNKKDLDHFRSVPREEGHTAAHQLGCLFFELSASEEPDNVRAAFSSILDGVRRRKARWRPSVKKVNSLPRTKKTNVRYLNVFSKLKHDKKRQVALK
ncbi:ras-related and estrogen-regulated growth inhibitor-like [Xenia sp. Carnegie-2017]|uniref:ras-related and estrogen-regulated growth inhibitor-like n=1 Tax=Xenia sp. Carnegie-2017 TaxID=2897299 RepID=UPI001F042079|nr:ras-related and estrogen-regulated growth inhibitor-like [Xenia sp. Carnegie-2017]